MCKRIGKHGSNLPALRTYAILLLTEIIYESFSNEHNIFELRKYFSDRKIEAIEALLKDNPGRPAASVVN